MFPLINLKKAPKEIAQILSQDTELCNLLVCDDENVLDKTTPTMTANDLINNHYIWFFPPVESGLKEFGRNTFLTILINSVRLGDKENQASISLFVGTSNNLINLANNRNRLLEICDLIINDLDDVKISSSMSLSVSYIQAIEFNATRSGYRIDISISDQQNERKF